MKEPQRILRLDDVLQFPAFVGLQEELIIIMINKIIAYILWCFSGENPNKEHNVSILWILLLDLVLWLKYLLR